MPDITSEASRYVRRLPIGERVPIGSVIDDELFPFEGEILVKALDPPTIPEPPRRGEPGGDPCPACGPDDESVVWQNRRWLARVAPEPHSLPMVVLLQPRAHHDLDDLPPELAHDLGPMIQRISRAIGRIEGIGRVHVNRWGDGSEHFHLWFLARPYGMWQMRGAMLAVWDDLLPRVPAEEWASNRAAFATAMAEGDDATAD